MWSAHLGGGGDTLPLGFLFQFLGHHGLLLLWLVWKAPEWENQESQVGARLESSLGSAQPDGALRGSGQEGQDTGRDVGLGKPFPCNEGAWSSGRARG